MANVRNMGSVATLGTKSIVANGTYNASADNLDGFSQVSVNVPSATLGTKSITENGTYNASSDNLDGFSQVSVDVPEAVLGTKSIIENGTYNASADNLDGYSQVSVNVPSSADRYIPWSSRRYSGWYVTSTGMFENDTSDPHAVSLSWPVQAGHTYMIATGNTYTSTKNRYGIASNDLVSDPVRTQLSQSWSGWPANSSKQYYITSEILTDGYLIGYVSLPNPDDGTVVYLFDVTGLDLSGRITV